MIKCVSFDFDATLAHVKPQTHTLILNLLKEKGFHVSIEKFKQQCIELRRNIPSHLKDHYNRYGTLSREQRIAFLKEYNKARIEMLQLDRNPTELEVLKNWLVNEIFIQQKKVLYDDVEEVVKRLADQGIKQYVLSGNHSDGIVEILQEANLLQYFEEIITVDKFSARKADNFQVLLDLSNFSPEEILHIGDDINSDGFGPRNFGINSLIIKRPEQLQYTQIEDESFTNIEKLTDLFREVNFD